MRASTPTHPNIIPRSHAKTLLSLCAAWRRPRQQQKEKSNRQHQCYRSYRQTLSPTTPASGHDRSSKPHITTHAITTAAASTARARFAQQPAPPAHSQLATPTKWIAEALDPSIARPCLRVSARKEERQTILPWCRRNTPPVGQRHGRDISQKHAALRLVGCTPVREGLCVFVNQIRPLSQSARRRMARSRKYLFREASHVRHARRAPDCQDPPKFSISQIWKVHLPNGDLQTVWPTLHFRAFTCTATTALASRSKEKNGRRATSRRTQPPPSDLHPSKTNLQFSSSFRNPSRSASTRPAKRAKTAPQRNRPTETKLCCSSQETSASERLV